MVGTAQRDLYGALQDLLCAGMQDTLGRSGARASAPGGRHLFAGAGLEPQSRRDLARAAERPRALKKQLSELTFPTDAVVAMITRGTTLIPARGTTRIEAGDHVFVVLRSDLRAAVDEFFSRDATPSDLAEHTKDNLAG